MIYYLDIFNFNNSKFWIFKLMGSYTFNKTIFNSSGLEFFKLLGTGSRNGFTIYPDFSTYITISSFIDEESRLNFLNHDLLKQMVDKSSFRIEKLIEPYQSKGTWNGVNPFKISSSYRDGEILVLTRARVRPIKILNFLKINNRDIIWCFLSSLCFFVVFHINYHTVSAKLTLYSILLWQVIHIKLEINFDN